MATERKTEATKATEILGGPSPSLKSLSSLPSGDGETFIPPHGGYQSLLSYQKALVVYDATVYFCSRFFHKHDRTHSQMVQAARSGKQNILEGSQASGTSKETEIKLTGVARASQQELLEDYRDFMRNRGIEEWTLDHPYADRLRELHRTPGANYATFKKGIEHRDPAISANVISGLIKVTCYLLDQQLRRLEQDFLKQGGLRERMTRARLAARARQGPLK
ncbi:MAG: four helix bundle protein [Verrucomicrobia bacterium]|nr:four helix bundle protein [Verrucomicrobiota bacterium]